MATKDKNTRKSMEKKPAQKTLREKRRAKPDRAAPPARRKNTFNRPAVSVDLQRLAGASFAREMSRLRAACRRLIVADLRASCLVCAGCGGRASVARGRVSM
jgi:hypothetical protein